MQTFPLNRQQQPGRPTTPTQNSLNTGFGRIGLPGTKFTSVPHYSILNDYIGWNINPAPSTDYPTVIAKPDIIPTSAETAQAVFPTIPSLLLNPQLKGIPPFLNLLSQE
jgi:hypothetical protein